MPHTLKYLCCKVSSLAIILLGSTWPVDMGLVASQQENHWGITQQHIASAISQALYQKAPPPRIALPDLASLSTLPDSLQVKYTLDAQLQNEAARLFKKYNPDYGVFVALAPDTGRVLAMADSTRDGVDYGNLSLINTFPAASISKIITAVAAVNENKANGDTVIPFNGKSTSLYKKNIFNHQNNKWTRYLTFDEAFAKSVNVIFGRLGAVELGGDMMLEYAHRLGFNNRFASDFSFATGEIKLDPNDQWDVAQMASGYTTNNTLSPLHGAILAATAVNGGEIVAPIIVESLTGPYGIPLYVNEQPALSAAMSPDTAAQLKKMMQATVTQGSARKIFRGADKGRLAGVNIGGKTGSLTGLNPRGKYDWFVGFGEQGEQKIAFAMLCINKEKWYVKSAQFAREMLEFYFSAKNDTDKSA